MAQDCYTTLKRWKENVNGIDWESRQLTWTHNINIRRGEACALSLMDPLWTPRIQTCIWHTPNTDLLRLRAGRVPDPDHPLGLFLLEKQLECTRCSHSSRNCAAGVLCPTQVTVKPLQIQTQCQQQQQNQCKLSTNRQIKMVPFLNNQKGYNSSAAHSVSLFVSTATRSDCFRPYQLALDPSRSL